MIKGFVVGGFITLIGIIMVLLSIIFGGNIVFDVREERIENTYVFSGEYDDIYIGDRNVPIYVGLSDDKNIHVTVFENDDEYYEIRENDDLRISYVNDIPWYREIINFGSHRNSYYTEVLVPKNLAPELEIKGVNGGIYIDNIKVDELEIQNVNGKITISDTYVYDDFYIKNVNGKIDIGNFEANDVEIQNVNGKIDISNIEANEEIYIKNVNGTVSVDTAFAGIGYDIETVNGTISLELVDFNEESEISSVNGKVSIGLVGNAQEYDFDVTTKNGSITFKDGNLEEYKSSMNFGKGDKKLEVKTSNGSVKIYIEK